MTRTNCWEHKKCGREPGGPKAAELGVCPVTTFTRANGLNDGRNGGRACWVISGTLCGGKVQGTFAQKVANCTQCDFFGAVKTEEGARYVTPSALLKLIG
jgi:hypothetical protein